MFPRKWTGALTGVLRSGQDRESEIAIGAGHPRRDPAILLKAFSSSNRPGDCGHGSRDKEMGKAVTGLESNPVTAHEVSNTIVDIPLNSSVGIIKDTKNSITDLKTFINSDGKWAITGNAAVKGTVNIQFVADGKKINVKLVVNR